MAEGRDRVTGLQIHTRFSFTMRPRLWTATDKASVLERAGMEK